MKSIQIFSPDNGVGLSKDRDILKNVLKEDFKVSWCDPVKDKPVKADINIHLEIVYNTSFRYAAKNVLFPNPEWFYHHWHRYLNQFALICAKTKDCERIFRNLGHKNVIFTSFTSNDMCINDVDREHKFAHFAGKSNAKGTIEVEKAMQSSVKVDVFRHNRPSDRIDDFTFMHLFNKYLFHVCPSYYEGFGHYINEAKSVGAIIITTNAPPMNELVSGSFAFGVSCKPSHRQNLAQMYQPSINDLAETLTMANSLNKENIMTLSNRARQSFLDNDKFFKEKIIETIKSL